MKKKNCIIFFVIFILLCSCGKNDAKNGKKKNDSNITTENQKMEAEKYNSYVLLYNHLLQIDEYIGYYFEIAGANEKMKKLEGKVNVPSINQSDYYKDGNYYKNKYLRTEMHLKFLEITKRYRTVSAKFKNAFKNRAKEQKNRTAEKIKKEGKLIEYELITFIDSCGAILDEIEREKLSAENVTNADLAKFKELEAKMTASLDKLKNSFENKSILKKENYHTSDFTSFLLYTERFKESTAKFISRIEKKENIEAKLLQNNPSLKNEPGTPENIFYEYNELIREYNKLSN